MKFRRKVVLFVYFDRKSQNALEAMGFEEIFPEFALNFTILTVKHLADEF